MRPEDELIAAGAVLMLLLRDQEQHQAVTTISVVTDDAGELTNQIDITLRFLRSPYRLTIRRTEETP